MRMFGGFGFAALCVAGMIVVAARPAGADMQIGKFTVAFAFMQAHRNGDFVVPGLIRGESPDGDFRADRAIGNYQRKQVTLIGHVVLHERPASAPHTPPQAPLTLTADQLHIDSPTQTYIATGSARAVQGARSLVADSIALNDQTHEGVFTGNVTAADSGRTLSSQEIHYNTVTGAIDIPVAVTGKQADGDFSADRAIGNQRAGTYTLFGHVVVHRAGGQRSAATSQQPFTLVCDRLDIASLTKMYVADGDVSVSQGDRTMNAPHLTLDDNTHIATMTGGVRGLQKPNSTFDAAELIYNTQTEDFKALGGVRLTFPYRRGGTATTGH